MRFRRTTWFLAALTTLTALAESIDGSSASTDDYSPQYTIDLRKWGYQEPAEKWSRFHVPPTKSLTFIDDETMAVSLFVRNPKPGFSERGKVFGGPYLFKTIFFDTNSGEVRRTEIWSNSTIGCGVFPAGNGRFVVWHDLEISLHASDGAMVRILNLDSKSFPRGASITQSPSGDTLFAARSDREGNHVLVIRTKDLHEITWLDLPGYFLGTGSDSYFAFLRPRPKIGPPMDLFILRFNGASEFSVPEKPAFTADPGCFSVAFLDEETLGISGGCPDLTLLKGSGEVQYHRRFNRVLTGPITACRGCDIVLFSTYVLTGGSTLLDTFPRAKTQSVALFDRKTQHLVEWQRKIPIKHPHAGSAALSPDGCSLAFQNDWHVEVYRICGSPIGVKLQMGSP